MGTDFVRWDPAATADVEALVDLLTGEDWPFHAGGRPDRATLLDRVAGGYYDGPGARTFWVVDGGERVGLLRLADLDDGTPLFDLRLRAPARGRGLGGAAVRWLTGYLFTELPGTSRIEATTRDDNAAMRRVLERAGWTQEARYRKAWPVPGGPPRDSIGYAILREEWDSGSAAMRPV